MEVIIQIITASIGATLSGIILLTIHHRKVKQELDIHRQKDEFDRKQKIYRMVLQHISRLLDQSHLLGSEVNWRITRQIYEELLIVGSPKVIKIYNNFILNLDKIEGKVEHDKLKELWNVIREDLYGTGLAEDEMHVISPSLETISALDIYHNNSAALKALNINNIESISRMDIDDVTIKSNIDKEKLKLLKNMAINELRFEEELRNIANQKISN